MHNLMSALRDVSQKHRTTTEPYKENLIEIRSIAIIPHMLRIYLGSNTKKREWKHKKEPALFDRHDDNNMSNKVRHPSSSTKLTFYKYYYNPSEVMLNNSRQKDNFSTAKASSFVNVTKKRKVKERLDARNHQSFDDIHTMSTNTNKQHIEDKNNSNFCSMNERLYDDTVINGGNFEKISYLNNYKNPRADNHRVHYSTSMLCIIEF